MKEVKMKFKPASEWARHADEGIIHTTMFLTWRDALYRALCDRN